MDTDEIYIKHNLGSFQQPYIFQQVGIGLTDWILVTLDIFIGNTRQVNIYQFRTVSDISSTG